MLLQFSIINTPCQFVKIRLDKVSQNFQRLNIYAVMASAMTFDISSKSFSLSNDVT